MKIVVTGDRHWDDRVTVEAALRLLLPIHLQEGVTVVAGGAKGLDTIAADVATELGYHVDVYEAEWDLYGRAAGPIRNKAMLDTSPDFVIAFHDNLDASKGTQNCVEQAEKLKIEVILLQSSDAALISDRAASTKDIETLIK